MSKDTDQTNPDVFEFELDLVTKPVKLKKEGKVVNCELRELTGSDRDKYLNVLTSKTKIDATGKTAGVKSFEGLQSSVLTRSLYNLDEDRFFNAKEADALPQRVIDKMITWVLKASGLGGEEEGNETTENKTNGDD